MANARSVKRDSFASTIGLIRQERSYCTTKRMPSKTTRRVVIFAEFIDSINIELKSITKLTWLITKSRGYGKFIIGTKVADGVNFSSTECKY